MNEKKIISIDDTNFIYKTNFSGDPANDRFGDHRRKCSILIPDPDQARDMAASGFKVRETRPRQDEDPDEFQPEYFITAILKYRNRNDEPVKYPPQVYLVTDDHDPVLLDEESVGNLDNIRVKNVNVVLNPYEYNEETHEKNLYVRTMYVEQDVEYDPYASRYYRN